MPFAFVQNVKENLSARGIFLIQKFDLLKHE